MSQQSLKGVLGLHSQTKSRNSPEPNVAAAGTSNISGRKRSNTKHRIPPPAMHLSLKTSGSPKSASMVDLTNEELRTPRTPKANEPLSGSASSSRSEFSSKTSGSSPSTSHNAGKYGTYITSSPLADSPASLSPGGMISTSLPATISPLDVDVEFNMAPFGPPPRTPLKDQPSPSYLGAVGRSGLRVPTSSSRKSSAASLDREAILHLDMKRLLSKPAKLSNSSSSIISLPSDQEMSTTSSPRNLRSFGDLSKKPDSRGRAQSGNATDGGISSRPLRTLREVSSRSSLPTAATEGDNKAPQKIRNVLRRKPSVRSNPATPTVTAFRTNLDDPNTTPRSSRTILPNNVRTTLPRRTTSAMAEPVSVNRIKRNDTTPAGLTPAGQVALAYKQQERRREELEEISGHDRSTDSPLRGFEDEDEEGSGAYYTVFGSTTGRVVAVGSAGDSSWDLDYDPQLPPEERARMAAKFATVSGSSRPAGVHSLSRKVSSRFKRVTGSVKRDREISPHGGRGRISETGEWMPYDGRPSTADKSSISTAKRSHATSMDEYVEVRTSITGGDIPSIPNGRGERLRKEKSMRTMRAPKGKEKEMERGRDDESSPKGKLWKLVKRISTGGLRDKYVRDTSPPPVPALPKELQHIAASRTTLDIRHPSGSDSPTQMSVSRFMQSRSSMSAVRPSTAPQKGSPRSENHSSRPSTGARPSTTTRSSSPMSSDMASSRFFHRAHSTHSSISSYGEELPPIPHGGIGNHIMSPSELYKLNKDAAIEVPKTRVRTRSQSAAAAPHSRTEEHPPSLPPPRRSNTAGKPSSTQGSEMAPPSPTIPTFNTLDPVNNFSTRLSLPTSEFGILAESTPPRPRRSSRRKPPPELTSPTVTTPISPPMPRTPRTSSPRSASADISGVSIVSGEGGSVSSTRSPLRFRELETSRSPLSEKEKAAKWDDLLERSDRAGGTLHLGETGLMSDNIRFSEYSAFSDLR
ncbi:hypothetical protein EIP86_005593 [Pleurotus ostreatoroseus]|nr:hypothetical protein EIP86_005593 [Pleurotus ostreatoroseus]